MESSLRGWALLSGSILACTGGVLFAFAPEHGPGPLVGVFLGGIGVTLMCRVLFVRSDNNSLESAKTRRTF